MSQRSTTKLFEYTVDEFITNAVSEPIYVSNDTGGLERKRWLLQHEGKVL